MPMPPGRLAVFYGEQERWSQARLNEVQALVGTQTVGWDGLQADFDLGSEDAAFTALLRLRAAGYKAEAAGVPSGLRCETIERERQIMRQNYRRMRSAKE